MKIALRLLLSREPSTPSPCVAVSQGYNSASMREVRLQTYWADADPAGIVYFAHFFQFIEQAEEELYLQSGKKRQSLLDQYSVWMPRVEAHITFVSPARNGYAILVRISPEFKGEKTVRFDFEIF